MNYLSGYKTYLAAAAGVLATLTAIASGHLSVADGAVAMLVFVVQAMQRSGSKVDAQKVVDQVGSAAAVAATVAPLAADLSPQLASLSSQVADMAEHLRAAAASATIAPSAASINKLVA